MKKIFFLTAVLVGAASVAQAGLHLSVGFGVPIAVPAPVYVAPPPVCVAPAPVYVAPSPVYVAPPPVVCVPPRVAYVAPPSYYFGYSGWSGGGYRGPVGHGYGGWRHHR